MIDPDVVRTPHTVEATLARGRARLIAFGDEGRFDAMRLLEEIACRNAAWIFAHRDDVLEASIAARYDAALARRALGEPVAYVVGSAGFYGRSFVVTRDVLVPRPESEGVVELALAALHGAGESGAAVPQICDIGTGSGALALTLACELPHARVTACDISCAALDVARENARLLGALDRVRFACGDLLAALEPHERFDCIVANLPYVRRGDLKPAPDATAFEPTLALDGGPDGLDLYRALLARVGRFIVPGGSLVMEAGPDTVPALAALAEATFAAPAEIVVHRDLALHERIVVVRTPSFATTHGQG